MKNILILLLFISTISFAQVTPSRSVRIVNSTTAFGETIPRGTIITDATTGKVYSAYLGLASTKTIATCVLNVELIDLTAFSLYLPLTGGTLTGGLNGTGASFTAPTNLASITSWTYNSDASSIYGDNAIGYSGANRKIFRAGIYLGSNGFTVDWIHSTSKFSYVFDQGDVTVNGLSGTGTRLVTASSTGVLSTTPYVSVTSGSFTPTITDEINSIGAVFDRALFTKIGSIVHVKVSGTLSSTTTGLTQISLTIPPSYSFNGNDLYTVGKGVIDEDSQLNITSGLVRYLSSTEVTFTFVSAFSGAKEFSIDFDYSSN